MENKSVNESLEKVQAIITNLKNTYGDNILEHYSITVMGDSKYGHQILKYTATPWENIVYDMYRRYDSIQFPDSYYCRSIEQLEQILTFLCLNKNEIYKENDESYWDLIDSSYDEEEDDVGCYDEYNF